MKKYKRTLIITSMVAISPLIVGLLLWNQLPDVIATHFGSGNVPNGWSSKPFAVLGLPLILLVLHIFTFFMMSSDPKRKNIDDKFFKWILWIVPVVSCVTCLSCYAIALGMDVNIGSVVYILVGVLFIVIGNYMHKVKQNYTVGIRIPWTLHSEENWNQTHKMASWLWIISGVVFVMNSVLQLTWLLFVVIIVSVVVPMGYSYWLYRKEI